MCLATIRARIEAPQFVVSPTVIQELVDVADNGETEAERELALTAAAKLVKEWRFKPFNCLPVGHGIVEEIGRKLRDHGLVPEGEVNDALVIAEAGLVGATLLVSSDHHIADIDQQTLKIVLDRADVSTPLIASPVGIVRKFFK